MDLYKIEPMTLTSFMTEGNYKLPRYQRRDTWKEKQYFGLCISVFQGYPIGVCIVNKQGKTRYLLDGRQRRTCLQKLYTDPVTVYDWAKSFCKFKNSWDNDQVASAFWREISTFLGKDIDIIQSDDSDSDLDVETTEMNDQESVNYKNDQLQKLLNLILLIHKKKGSSNPWFRAFDFTPWFHEKNISYYKDPNGLNGPNKVFIPSQLTAFIRETMNKVRNSDGEFKENLFVDTIEDRWIYNTTPDTSQAKQKLDFRKHVNIHWTTIKNSYQAIYDLNDVFDNLTIGMISLTGANTFDAQNIFSRINSGGTQLKAAELLSAKPYWNESIDVKKPLQDKINLIYKKLNIDISDSYVRWDIPATFISMIDRHNIFFTSHNGNDDIQDVNTEEIALGFKIFSAYYVGGISKISLDKLEGKNIIDWDSYEDFTNDFINMFKVITDGIPRLKYLKKWNMTINDMLGFAPTVELVVLALKRWIAWNRPGDQSTDGKKFLNEFKNHLDRLILEKVSGKWKGSSDSRVAANLSPDGYAKRIDAISDTEHNLWSKLINDAILGSIDGQATKLEALKPLLYYAKIIMKEKPEDCDEEFEIDHIYPQALFDSTQGIKSEYKESLTNLALLAHNINAAKKDKKLENVSSKYKDSLSYYENVPVEDFPKYSDILNFNDLIKTRGESFKEIFNKHRLSYLLNN